MLRWAWLVQLYCKTNRIIHNNSISLSASPLVLEWLCFQQGKKKKNTWHGLLLTLTLPINILKVISVYSFPSPIPKRKILNTGFLLFFLLHNLQLPLGERDWRRQNKQTKISIMGLVTSRENYSLRGNVSCAFLLHSPQSGELIKNTDCAFKNKKFKGWGVRGWNHQRQCRQPSV